VPSSSAPHFNHLASTCIQRLQPRRGNLKKVRGYFVVSVNLLVKQFFDTTSCICWYIIKCLHASFYIEIVFRDGRLWSVSRLSVWSG